MTTTPIDGRGLALAAHKRLARTVNLGPDLDIDQAHLEACVQNGFTAIRLLTCLAAHRTPSGLDPALLRRLEAIVDQATALGLAVIISNHRDPELMADPCAHLEDRLAAAAQLASMFAGRNCDVILEPLAEPCGALDAVWNEAAAGLIGAVRGQDRCVTILLGPRSYNNARFLGELSLPEAERNLIVGIHHFWPAKSTIQDDPRLGDPRPGDPRPGDPRPGDPRLVDTELGRPAGWLGTTWDPSPAAEAELWVGFGAAADWGRATGRPLFLAEFGPSQHADPASRARWTRFNRLLAEEHGIPWGIWSFAPTCAADDPQPAPFDPDLLKALMDLPRPAPPAPLGHPPRSPARRCRRPARPPERYESRIQWLLPCCMRLP
jgi:endoglucanase